MALKVKQNVVKNIYNVLHNKVLNLQSQDLYKSFDLNLQKDELFWKIQLPKSSTEYSSELFKSQTELLDDKVIKEVTCRNFFNESVLNIKLDIKNFIKSVVDSDPVQLNYTPSSNGNVIVEFSSPNIAKPFHVGHLRSTMIGNCLANIKKKMGREVIKMNYLGDWGTQFGIIQLGVEEEKISEESLREDPIMLLYKAYVIGNRAAEKSFEKFERAQEVFKSLESGKENVIKAWNTYLDWTKTELNSLYERLGVTFDEYAFESSYKRDNADGILKILDDKGLLSMDEKGRKVVSINDQEIPLIKSNNTTLYLMRDLMAAADRKSKHKFNEMYYVVENGQNAHFTALFNLCNELNISEDAKMKHVKFGKIHGMSTRKGKVVFLNDILEEAKQQVHEKQVTSTTSKVALENEEVCDILGVSAVVVNDLKHNRKKDYNFSWDECVTLKGNTGVNLQYCHCRLNNLEELCTKTAATECDPEAILEPEAVNLVLQIARFEDAILKADEELQPNVLLNYLFGLTKAVNVAYKVLPIKHEEDTLGKQRLLLFNKSRQVLLDGLKLLGLKPLSKM